MRFKSKVVVIDAERYNGKNAADIAAWAGWMSYVESLAGLEIKTLEGTMLASPGDWIIKGLKGEFYPCKPDVFAMKYEPEVPNQLDRAVRGGN